jgi:hypothetical protein
VRSSDAQGDEPALAERCASCSATVAATRSARRWRWLTRLVPAGFVAGVLLSWPLWRGPRSFPLAPAFPAAGRLPSWTDGAAILMLLAGLTATTIVRRPGRAIALVLGAGAVLASRDQMRWQPWFYQYSSMLAVLALYSRDATKEKRESVLNACRLIVASIYF